MNSNFGFTNNNFDSNTNNVNQNRCSQEQKPFVPCVCPRCGANLWIDNGLDVFYCQYCGCKILLQNETNLKTRFGMKKLEHTEKIADKIISYFDKKTNRKRLKKKRSVRIQILP